MSTQMNYDPDLKALPAILEGMARGAILEQVLVWNRVAEYAPIDSTIWKARNMAQRYLT